MSLPRPAIGEAAAVSLLRVPSTTRLLACDQYDLLPKTDILSPDVDFFVVERRSANTLTALADREEPKDVADIWGFCCRMGMPIRAALDNADSKAAGLFPPDLARRLLGTTIDCRRTCTTGC